MRGVGSLVVLLICFFLGAYGNAIKDNFNSHGLNVNYSPEASSNREVDIAVLSLAQQDLNLPHAGYLLDILTTHYRLSAEEVNDMLAPAHGQNYPLIYSIDPIGTYTMSAQALDGDHYLVNTYLEGYAPFEVNNVMTPLYILSQRKTYQFDASQYAGRTDVWQSSRQAFYYPRGDCEDHAIVLADWLIEQGEDARVVLGEVEGNGGHAWVILLKDGKEYLLEATQKDGLSAVRPYPAAVLYRDYHPRYMFNREYFWENTGTQYTTSYSNKYWLKKSHYRITDYKSRQFKDKVPAATSSSP
ncbi:MAG: hypothetical protein ACSHWN_02890 [Methylophilaceae bacterium]